MLNILVIAPQLPYPPDNGGISRLYNLYGRLARKHRLTWLCPVWPGNEIYVQEAERICDRVIELSRDWQPRLPDSGWRKQLMRVVAHLHWERLFEFFFGYVEAPGLYWLPASSERRGLVDDVASSMDFDLVVCEFEGNAELVPEKSDAPTAIMLQNAPSTLYKRIRRVYDPSWMDRLFFWPEWAKVVRYEKRNYAQFDLAGVVSEADGRLVQRRCPNLHTELVPNGVDLDYFRPIPKSTSSHTLLYFGHFGYPPNSDAIRYFCADILPLIRKAIPDVQVLVAGRRPPQELSSIEGVQVLGFVPDIRTSLAQAAVVIVPLRVGGGSRIKILEALAMEKAVVSTTLGAEGLEVTHEEHVMLADRPADFADSVIRLLENPQLRTHLGQNGRALVEQHHDWDVLAAKVDKAFQQIVAKGRGGQRDLAPLAATREEANCLG